MKHHYQTFNKTRLFICLCFLSGLMRAQFTPLSFTVNIAVPVNTITCSQTFVAVYVQSNYTVSPVTYSWTNGSANYTGTLVNITSPGLYTITATANPTLTQTSTFSVPVNTLAPSATLSPLSQGITCTLAAAQITAVASSSSVTHTFKSPVGGFFSTQGLTANYLPGVPGTYTYIVMDINNGCQTQKTFTVTSASGFPTFSISCTDNFSVGCSSKSLTTINIVQASTQPPGGALSYTITPIAPYNTGTASSYTFSTNTTGNYSVVVRDNATSCAAIVPISVISNTVVPFPGFIQFGNGITCKEPKWHAQLYQLFPGNYSFDWSTDTLNPFPPNYLFDTITVFPASNHSLTSIMSPWMVATDLNNLCSFAIATTISQDLLPPFVTLHSNYSGISCQHPYVTLHYTGQSSYTGWNPGNVYADLWQGPPPQATGTLSSGYLGYVPGIYTVHVVDTRSGCTNTDTILIKDLRAYPQVTAPLQPFELCSSFVTIQPVDSSHVPLQFTWQSGANIIYSNPTPGQAVVNGPGIYTVVVTDPASTCSVSLQLTVSICSGIEANSFTQPELSMYPNPSGAYLMIESNESVQVTLSDAGARPLMQQTIDSGKNKIDLGGYPPGIYMLTISRNGVIVKTEKIVRQN